MRHLRRTVLSTRATKFLTARTAKVVAATDPKNESARLWAQQGTHSFKEVREALRAMATGRERCMYCEDSQGTDIDHFCPRAREPAKAFEWDNLFLACSHCNSNEKRDRFPTDSAGLALLIDPVLDEPYKHLDFVPDTGDFVARSRKGTESIDVFGLDRQLLIQGRRDQWIVLLVLVPKYADLVAKGDAMAEDVGLILRRAAFSSILYWLTEIATLATAATVIPEPVLRALRARPEIRTWVRP